MILLFALFQLEQFLFCGKGAAESAEVPSPAMNAGAGTTIRKGFFPAPADARLTEGSNLLHPAVAAGFSGE